MNQHIRNAEFTKMCDKFHKSLTFIWYLLSHLSGLDQCLQYYNDLIHVKIMSLLDYEESQRNHSTKKMTKSTQRLLESKAICGYWDHLTPDNVSQDLDSDFVKKKLKKRLPFIDEP